MAQLHLLNKRKIQMYKFTGYIVEQPVGNVVHFANTRSGAELFCKGHGVQFSSIHQVFKFSKAASDVVESSKPPSDKVYVPNSQNMLVQEL